MNFLKKVLIFTNSFNLFFNNFIINYSYFYVFIENILLKFLYRKKIKIRDYSLTIKHNFHIQN